MFYDGHHRPIDPRPVPSPPERRVPGEAFLLRMVFGVMLFLLVLPISAGTLIDIVHYFWPRHGIPVAVPSDVRP